LSFPQIYCRPIPQTRKVIGDVVHSDNVLFAPEKRGLFQLVVLVGSFIEVSNMDDTLGGITPVSADIEQLVNEATYIVHNT
jgi:hypothetical protein